MKYTLLDMTQNVLSRMSSDEVNSISDTPESLQVANIIKNKYFDIINRVDLPEHDQLIQLDPSIDAASPVLMYIPSGVTDIKWLKYFDSNVLDSASSTSSHDTNTDITTTTSTTTGIAPGYLYVTILPVNQFVEMVNGFDPSASNVDTLTLSDNSNNFPGDFTFYYKNDRQPCYCTIISNYYVIFDSFDSTQDSTLQGSKTMAWGRIIPQFELVDSFIPDLAEEQFQLLVNEATALAFFELKQEAHPLALKEVNRGWSSIQKNKAVTNRPTYFNELPNFGRHGWSSGTRGFNNGNNGWNRWQ